MLRLSMISARISLSIKEAVYDICLDIPRPKTLLARLAFSQLY